MATDIQIRARLLAHLTEAASRGVDGLGTVPLALGSRFMRRGRYVVCTTSQAGIVIFGRVSADLKGLATVIGPPAKIQLMVPPELRDAWIAGDTNETDVDPTGVE